MDPLRHTDSIVAGIDDDAIMAIYDSTDDADAFYLALQRLYPQELGAAERREAAAGGRPA